jgi:ribonuclease J
MGEIGRNCTVIECGDAMIAIDCGLMFPEDDMLGVDLVIPDMSYLIENRDRLKGIIITHGHEDHIGALAYLLKDVSVPIYGTPLTCGLIENKGRSNGGQASKLLNIIQPNKEFQLGPFGITPFHVTHSIPDAVGYAIRTPLGLVVHTGDFKIDHTPTDGKNFDLGALSRLANEGVILLMSDSTNAESPGYTLSEQRLVDSFQQAFAKAKGRIIVATFASLISRVQLIIETAARLGRKVAVAGRSMEDNVAIAEKLGYIRFPEGVHIALRDINKHPDNEVVVIATGSQGEPNAALARMASGRYRQLQIREGDTVMLSSKAIPGNETQVYRNIDELFRRGARVVYGERAGMHVSGHAAQEELKLMLNLLRPLYFVPVHGEYRMLRTHADLAYELGFATEDVFVLENGDCLELTPAGAQRNGRIALSTVLVDGSLVGDVGDTILRDRHALANEGVVIAKVIIEHESRQLREPPEIISQGFVYVPESGELLAKAVQSLTGMLANLDEVAMDEGDIARRVKRRLEKLFEDETGRHPVVIPMVDTNPLNGS